MPSIELRSAFGNCYRIDSNNIETIKAWFDEILPVIATPEMETIILVSARFWGNNPNPDWPVGSANGYTRFDSLNGKDGIDELESLRRKAPWPYNEPKAWPHG